MTWQVLVLICSCECLCRQDLHPWDERPWSTSALNVHPAWSWPVFGHSMSQIHGRSKNGKSMSTQTGASSVCVSTWLSCNSSTSSIFASHLQFRTPAKPGTTTRTGKPWSEGNTSPFMVVAKIASPKGSMAFLKRTGVFGSQKDRDWCKQNHLKNPKDGKFWQDLNAPGSNMAKLKPSFSKGMVTPKLEPVSSASCPVKPQDDVFFQRQSDFTNDCHFVISTMISYAAIYARIYSNKSWVGGTTTPCALCLQYTVIRCCMMSLGCLSHVHSY